MKYTVCVSMDEKLQATIVKGLERFSFTKDDTVEFVHIFKEELYNYMLPPSVYPPLDQRETIRESAIEIMKDMGSKVQALSDVKVDYHSHFNNDPKASMVEYLKESSPNLTFVATRGKHGIAGLFTSSFAEYLLKFSPCDVYIIR